MVNPSDSPIQASLKFVVEHFALFSALAIGAGFLASTIFVYSYLSVFNWHLIWFVEYTDLIKFALISVGILSPSLYLIYNGVDLFSGIRASVGRYRWLALFIVFFGVAVIFGGLFYQDSRSTHPRWATHAAALGVVLLLFLIAARTQKWLFPIQLIRLREKIKDVAHFEVPPWPDAKAALLDGVIVTGFIIALGLLVGSIVKEGVGLGVNVTLDTEELRNAGLVMFTPHHAVFFVGNNLVVVPSDRVRKVESIQP